MAAVRVMAGGPSKQEALGALPCGCPTPQDIWHNLDAPWRDQVQAQTISTGAVVLINEADPSRFLANLWTGLLADAAIILANPSWRRREWQQVADQLTPEVILGELPSIPFSPSKKQPAPGQILIATGGTSGQIKFVIHTWATLTAAAQGFLDHFNQQPVNSYCVLPLYHVSGLMQAMRVWLSGGRLIIQSFRQLESGQRLVTPHTGWFISLVPTQLQRLIADANGVAWLAQFRAILLGGAPAGPGLLAQVPQLPIALTYGMSETAAQVATLFPEDFQRGLRSSGCPLPHVQLAIHRLESFQDQQPVSTSGRIALKAPSLGLGYWPDRKFSQTQDWFYPDDLGYLDAQGHLHVVGRNSQKIITGGENVFPAEVEAALLATGLVQDACVVGLPDPVWGQTVAALCVPVISEATPQQLKTALQPILSAYKHPKHWQLVAQIPRNEQGKVNRAQVAVWLSESTGSAQDSGGAAGG